MTASHFIHIFFCLCFIIFYCLFGFILFRPLYLENCVIFTHSVHPFDLCYSYPLFWSIFKICFIIIYFLCAIIYSKLLDSFIFSKIKIAPKIIDNSSFCLHSSKELSLKIGINSISQQSIFLSSSSLYQNILITGTIGTGKTSSAIFPFSKQFIQYESQNPNLKLSILCLDVKGNLIYQIQKYVKEHHRENDLIILSPESSETYNPLDKPNLSPFVLAHRLKTILTLFSPNNTESYWLDKVEQILAEAIKLCRLSHNNYITFLNIHKFITDKEYYYAQLNHLRNLFHQNHFSNSEIYDLLSGIEFFEKEFYELDDRTQSILKSEVSRITNYFVSNYTLSELFVLKHHKFLFMDSKRF